MSTSNTPSEDIVPGSTVKILDPETRFIGDYGLVIDVRSTKRPQDGPIAVYFDEEIGDHQFYTPSRGERSWKGRIPTIDDYADCPRVICFQAEQMEIADVPIEVLVRRKFGDNWNILHAPSFKLVPHTIPCCLKDCVDTRLATHITMQNAWGTIMVCYTCEDCHQKWHGARVDWVDLKDPLPKPLP